MKTVTVSVAKPSQLTEIIALKTSVYQATFRPFFANETIMQQRVVAICQQQVTQQMEDPNSVIHVAVQDGQLVGMSAMTITDTVAVLNGKYCSVQGQGIGSLLLQTQIQEARHRQCSLVQTEVLEYNYRSLQYLHRNDFQVVGVELFDDTTVWAKGNMLLLQRAV